MLSEYVNAVIKKGDLVKVVGKGTGYDGALCRVLYMNDLTATATVQVVRKYGQRDIHISKLELQDRAQEQFKLF